MHISHKAMNDQVFYAMKKCRVVVLNMIFKVLGQLITDLYSECRTLSELNTEYIFLQNDLRSNDQILNNPNLYTDCRTFAEFIHSSYACL